MSHFNRPLWRFSLLPGLIAAASPAAAQSSAEAAARQFPARVLAAHNAERVAAGVQLLKWDPKLGLEAAKYAVQLALSRRFAHSPQASRAATGENLWMGTRSAYSIEAMVAGWSSEKRLFVPGVFPAVSRNGNWEQVGHYTQMVWPKTESVGCALASSGGEEYLVCRYFPAGNVYGHPLRVLTTGLRRRN